MPDRVVPGIYLGFDFGQKRIGVAVGQTVSQSASALESIPSHRTAQWRRLGQIVAEWRPVGAVVGMPLTADGNVTDLQRRIKKFIAQFQTRFALPIYEMDERLSSYAAQAFLPPSKSGAKPPLDETAAALILQTWFDEQYDRR